MYALKLYLIMAFAVLVGIGILALPVLLRWGYLPGVASRFWQFFAFISAHTDATIVVSILVAVSIVVAVWLVVILFLYWWMYG